MADIYSPARNDLDRAIKKRERLFRLVSDLKGERTSFESHWRELSEFFKPRRARFTPSEANRGNKRSTSIIDSTGTFALRTSQAGMHSGMTSPARPWFRLTVPDSDLAEYGPVKEYLHNTAVRMSTMFAKTNLYNSLPIVYGDMACFGTSAVLVDEDDRQTLRTYTFPLGTYWLGLDDKLQVRVFAREFRMTVRQLVGRFGEDNCSRPVRQAYRDGNLERWVDVTHVISPNDEYDGERLRSRDKEFASCYFENGAGAQAGPGATADIGFLRESGYDEFPIFAPRWEVAGEDVYGTDCPGMVALGDVKQLQHGERKSLKAVDKMIDPPMVGPTALKTMRSSLLPGDVTYVDDRGAQTGFRPAHEVRFSLQDLEFKQSQVRERINRAMYADLFLMLYSLDQQSGRGRQPPTATEIAERHEEKLLVLGPVLEQTNQDLLDPLIDRAYNVMHRRGQLPPPPPELEGTDLRVEYVSVLHQAQKMVALSGLERFSGYVQQIATINPAVVDKVNFDEAIDQYGEAAGVPPKLINSDEQVAEVRKARAKAEQMKQAAEMASKIAPAAQQLSETDPTTGALGALAGGGGVPVGAGGLNA